MVKIVTETKAGIENIDKLHEWVGKTIVVR